MQTLSKFKALSFDCYGTLIDWDTGIRDAFKPLLDQTGRESEAHKLMELYEQYESRQQMQTPLMPYPQIMAIAYKRIAERLGASVSWDQCVDFGQSVKQWTPFDDSVETLAYLKQHFKLVILSNVDNESFAWSNQRLGVSFDAIYTAQEIGSYKPDEKNFRFMIEMLGEHGITKDEILHVAGSLYHDHGPANRIGLSSCWIDRRGQREKVEATSGEAFPRYDYCFASLAEFGLAHQESARQDLS